MLNKYFLYLLICLLCLSIEIEIEKLKQYGEKTLYEKTYLYLSLDGFDIGDEVYIELEFFYSRSSAELDYLQSDTHNKMDFEYDFNNYEIYGYNNKYTFYFTIELRKKTDYLLLKPPNFDYKLIVRHTRNSHKILLIIIGIIVILVIIAIIIAAIIRSKRKKQTLLLTTNLPKQNYTTYPNYVTNPQQYGNQLYVN